MSKTGIIYGVNGPVIYLKGDTGFKISEMVYVGPEKLVGEVIGLKKHMTTVQVFEETTGLKPGETVTGTGEINVADYGAPNNRFWYFIVSPSTSDTEEIFPLLRITDQGKKIIWENIEEPLTFWFGVY